MLAACALKQDLALMPDGDMTEVGERGITVRRICCTHLGVILPC